MRLKYTMISMLDVQHDFFEGLEGAALEWVPSSSTQRWMKAHGLICRYRGSRLYVLAPLDEDQRPLRPWKGIPSWVFHIRILEESFARVTHLPGFDRQHRYYFSSLEGIEKSGKYYLHPLPRHFEADRDYEAGDRVLLGDKVYESRQQIKAPAAPPASSPAQWRELGPEPRVDDQSLVRFAGSRLGIRLEEAVEEVEYQFYHRHPETGVFDLGAHPPHTIEFPGPEQEVSLDLSFLRPGIYLLELNGESRRIYREESSVTGGLLGVAEIAFGGHSSADWDLMTGEGRVRRRDFSLHFGARSAYWLYQTRTAQVTALKEKENRIEFESLPGNRYLSSLPVPMKQKPDLEIHLESTLLGQVGPLRMPSPQSLRLFEKNGKQIPCIQQHLSY